MRIRSASASASCLTFLAWLFFFLTSSVSARTVQHGIRFFRSQFVTDYTAMYAAIVLTMIPTIAVYIGLHERIIKGLTSGAIKG